MKKVIIDFDGILYRNGDKEIRVELSTSDYEELMEVFKDLGCEVEICY